jgi:hypothetical protein
VFIISHARRIVSSAIVLPMLSPPWP